MNPNSLCVQGTVTKVPIKCKEMPFFVNQDGNIAFRVHNYVVMNIFGNSKGYANEIVKGLNCAFELGYETDRFEWK